MHQCARELCWKIIILQWNKLATFNVVMTLILWSLEPYLLNNPRINIIMQFQHFNIVFTQIHQGKNKHFSRDVIRLLLDVCSRTQMLLVAWGKRVPRYKTVHGWLTRALVCAGWGHSRVHANRCTESEDVLKNHKQFALMDTKNSTPAHTHSFNETGGVRRLQKRRMWEKWTLLLRYLEDSARTKKNMHSMRTSIHTNANTRTANLRAHDSIYCPTVHKQLRSTVLQVPLQFYKLNRQKRT
jgi:hypothetical protein